MTKSYIIEIKWVGTIHYTNLFNLLTTSNQKKVQEHTELFLYTDVSKYYKIIYLAVLLYSDTSYFITYFN